MAKATNEAAAVPAAQEAPPAPEAQAASAPPPPPPAADLAPAPPPPPLAPDPAPPVQQVATAVPAKQRDAKVRALENHQCHIGGRTYILKKDETMTVPHDVANILQNSRVAIVVF